MHSSSSIRYSSSEVKAVSTSLSLKTVPETVEGTPLAPLVVVYTAGTPAVIQCAYLFLKILSRAETTTYIQIFSLPYLYY